VLLFEGEWHCRYFSDNNPNLDLSETPIQS
jgi:hypothetical protein